MVRRFLSLEFTKRLRPEIVIGCIYKQWFKNRQIRYKSFIKILIKKENNNDKSLIKEKRYKDKANLRFNLYCRKVCSEYRRWCFLGGVIGRGVC